MAKLNHISINNLSHKILDTAVDFKNINLTFTEAKYGFIGDNGVGKTTLLNFIAGVNVSQQGSVKVVGSIAYCQQHYDYSDNTVIAEVLDVSDKIKAIAKISAGSVDEEAFTVVGDDWDISQRVIQILQELGLQAVNLSTRFSKLSGGQKTKVQLARVFLTNADFIVPLDG